MLNNDAKESLVDSNCYPVTTKLVSAFDKEPNPNDYVAIRNKIFPSFPFYSDYTEKRQYKLLAPYVSHDKKSYVVKNTDSFYKTEFTRLLAPSREYDGDDVNIIGTYICNKYDQFKEYQKFDADAYITSINKLAVGNKIVALLGKSQVKGRVIETNKTFIGVDLENGLRLRYFYAMDNVFMLYDAEFEPKFPKADFLKENIVVNGSIANVRLITSTIIGAVLLADK
jgi:hypothetical protein